MSRVGKMPVAVPKGVDVQITADQITVKGANGALNRALHALVSVKSPIQSAVGALHRDLICRDLNVNALGDGDRHLSNAGHRSSPIRRRSKALHRRHRPDGPCGPSSHREGW